jgi:AcrR family transcriptional regulator
MEQENYTKDRIREQAKNLFFKYGIRSVSMDDLSAGLGISKKTIYQWFKDKDELVQAIIDQENQGMQADCEQCLNDSKDAIEEIFLTLDRMILHLKNMNPMVVYDLQKFHFQSFKSFSDYKNKYLLKVITNNLERGIAEGLYRDGLNIAILSRYRLEAMMIAFNQEVFPAPEFNLIEVTMTLIENFLYGVVTPKGYDLIVQYQNERNTKSKQK